MHVSDEGYSSLASLPPLMSGFQIVLVGRDEDDKTTLANFIMQTEAFHKHDLSRTCGSADGEWKGKAFRVVKTSDVFSLPSETVRDQLKSITDLPGPNILLLLVKPLEFTERRKQQARFILSLFGPDAFKHSIIVITDKEAARRVAVIGMIAECEGRQYHMYQEDREELMGTIESILCKSKHSCNRRSIRSRSECFKPPLNLVLCGSRGAQKTSAAEAILGQKDLCSFHRSAECVKQQAVVGSRRVSVVELPALYGKPPEEVMKESLRSISLCDPEGVHAFILVLPVGPLTDEDKGEIEALQNAFNSQIFDFTMILFIMESNPQAPNIAWFLRLNSDVQELCQSCGERYIILNIKDKQQVPEVLETVEKMMEAGCGCFSKDMLNKAHLQLKREVKSHESIRMVLIGRTGSGKSATANTILGKDYFNSRASMRSVTKVCQKSVGEVDGQRVTVVDTPGLFDTNVPSDDIHRELVKCVSLLAPGPHVFLVVIQFARCTKEEIETVELIRKYFGSTSENFIIILFTRGDEMGGKSIERHLEEDSDDYIRKLIDDCGGRYHVFNNMNRFDRTQVTVLITKINTMLKMNGGSYYTNEMFQEAEAAINEETQRILKEKYLEMKQELDNIKKNQQKTIQELSTKIALARNKRTIELQEKALCIYKEKQKIQKEKERNEELIRQIRQDWSRQQEVPASDRREVEEYEEETQRQREEREKEKYAKFKEQMKREEERLDRMREEYEQEEARKKQQEDEAHQQKEEEFRKIYEEIKRSYEEEARRKAEESNSFSTRYRNHCAAMMSGIGDWIQQQNKCTIC